jgi:sulfotransferase
LDRLSEIFHQGWDKKMLILRYEDLTSQPDETMQKIYQYLELPHFKHNFLSIEQVTQEDDSVYDYAGLHNIRSKLEPVPNDYLEILGRGAVHHLQTNYAWYFKLFGYHLIGVG